jgi:uncharacterized protein (DUF3084 family)
MPTQEERLTIVEQSVTILQKGMRDINHNSTILLGVVSEQGKDIREIKARLVDMSERLDIFEQSTNAHFEMQGKQIEANSKQIEANTRQLEANSKQIEANTRQLEANSKQIEANTKLLAEHSEILAEHGKILAKHSEMLAEHGEILAKHSEMLAEHGRKLDQILLILNTLVSRLDQGQA